MKYVTANGQWKKGVSDRRYELILKKLDNTATAEELQELDAINCDMKAYHSPKWERNLKRLDKILEGQQHAVDKIDKILADIGGLDCANGSEPGSLRLLPEAKARRRRASGQARYNRGRTLRGDE